MNVRLLQTALGLSLAGVIAMAGCSGDSDDDDRGPNGPTDTGMTGGGEDAGPDDTDAGVPDTGTPDSGVHPDAGPGVCDEGLLGCPCTPGGEANPAGNCVNPDHVCAQWSGQGEPLVATCVAVCEAENGDADCAGEVVAGDEERPAALCRGGLCVEEEAVDGEDCVRAAATGETMAGCLPGSACITGVDFEAPPYIGSCGLRCDDDTDCGNDKPFCNPQVLSGTVAPGICSDARFGLGAGCRPTDITGQCDSSFQFASGGPKLNCFAIGITDSDDEGHCYEICDVTDPEAEHCIGQSDPNQSPVCKTGVFTNPDIGLCSDECSQFPDNCSEPGTNDLGQSCILVPFAEDLAYNWCYDVNPPVLEEWDGPLPLQQGQSPSPDQDCGPGLGQNSRQFQCPSGSTCVDLSATSGICVRGCNPLAAESSTTGCELTTSTATSCASFADLGVGTDEDVGVCIAP